MQTGHRCSADTLTTPALESTSPPTEGPLPSPSVVTSLALEVPKEKLTGRSSSAAGIRARPSPLWDRFVTLATALPNFLLREAPRTSDIRPGVCGGCWTRSECQNRLCWVSSSELENPAMQCSQKIWLLPLLPTVYPVVELPAWLLGVWPKKEIALGQFNNSGRSWSSLPYFTAQSTHNISTPNQHTHCNNFFFEYLLPSSKNISSTKSSLQPARLLHLGLFCVRDAGGLWACLFCRTSSQDKRGKYM